MRSVTNLYLLNLALSDLLLSVVCKFYRISRSNLLGKL
jgi:hypothetical protein